MLTKIVIGLELIFDPSILTDSLRLYTFFLFLSLPDFRTIPKNDKVSSYDSLRR